DKLLAINQDMKDQFGLAMTYEFYGHNYFAEGRNLDQAKTYYLRSLALFQQINNRSKQADVFNSLGNLFLKQGNLALAKDHFQQSLEIARSLNHKELIKDNAGQLAYLYEETSNLAQAL